ncbi:uncharacterized protein LOC113565581 [Drosophila persimilis]|uniref:uncharacterized protein LOC113565581 n=1 Tax=Drosophila persimilis TaxID=7234 RepID=UPI000F08518B|nr:uncharacterized protein LOC113565581 [Drosophila persimilis]
MKNPLYFLFWLIVLLWLSFFVAFFGAFFYIWTYMFSQCGDCCEGIATFFLKCVQFPGYCAAGMMQCKKPC